MEAATSSEMVTISNSVSCQNPARNKAQTPRGLFCLNEI